MARIHEQTLKAWITPDHSSAVRERELQRARAFFAEVIAPIEKTHRPVREADARLSQLNQALRDRTVESSTSSRDLKRRIIQRQAAEVALKKSGQHRAKLEKESRRLQKHSRHLAREILSTQEDQRWKLSRQLHDEIAQMLLGVHVRLLTLKTTTQSNEGNLKKEIASTQRLVRESARAIRRLAREFGLHHET
jgi:signal transduction histidine kinase